MARNDFSSNYLAHHGILGQKWGIRRYQNPDGTLTSAGRERYGVKEGGSISDISSAKGISRRLNDIDKAKARNVKTMTDNLKKAGRKRSIANDNKYSKRVLKAQENIKKGDDEIESLLNKAEKLGYETSSKSTRRLVSSGAEMIAGTLLTSTLATGMLLPFGRAAVIPYAQTVKGTEYKVKNKSEEKTFTDKFAEANEKASQRLSINASVEKGLAEYKANHNGLDREGVKIAESFGKIPKNLQQYYGKEGEYTSYTKQKIGNDKVDFEINNSKYDSNSKSYIKAETEEKAVARAQKFLKEFNVEKAKESITKEYYDKFVDDYKEQGLTRAEFKAALKPYHVDIDQHECYVSFDDGGNVGYHSLDIGLDPETMKIKYHSMNG